MFRPLSLYIGLRYGRSKRRGQFVSFVSLVSILGVALGVGVLITVLSVMNGFDAQISQRIFAMTPQVTVTHMQGYISDWQTIIKQSHALAHVRHEAPYVGGQIMLTRSGQVRPALVQGVKPKVELNMSALGAHFLVGSLEALKPGKFGIVLGDELATALGVGVGDKVTMVTAQAALSPVGLLPRFKRFTVQGLFHVGSGFGFDRSLAYIHLKDAQTLFRLGSHVTGVHLRLDDFYAAPTVADRLARQLPEDYVVQDWTATYGAFFKAIQMEKTMMFVILVLIIGVAAFNLVSSLVMIVNEKASEIAILRTLGITARTILSTFMVMGSSIGLIGIGLGVALGLFLTSHISQFVTLIEQLFRIQLINPSVYFLDHLPIQLEWKDVWDVCGIALSLSLLATVYPAWCASRTQPAKVLRYE